MTNWEQQFKQASQNRVEFAGEKGGFSWGWMIGTVAVFIFGIEALRWKGKKKR